MPHLRSPRGFLASTLKKAWAYPAANEGDINAARTIVLHREIVERKRLLREAHMRWYRECLPAYRETTHLNGKLLEIGCGAGFLDKVIPGLYKTDVVENPYAQRVMNGMQLDFPNESLRAIFAIGVVHHMSDPSKFLSEAERVLEKGGRVVMLEPHNTFVQRFLCKFLDHYEFFDDTITDWANPRANRMSGANMAISWVMFIRDRNLFDRRFPGLQVKAIRYHTFLPYIASGGMAFRPFLPSAATPLVNASEVLLRPLMSKIGTIMTIDLVKR